MAPSNEFFIVHLEERIGGGEKLRMENNLERERERERERMFIALRTTGSSWLKKLFCTIHLSVLFLVENPAP